MITRPLSVSHTWSSHSNTIQRIDRLLIRQQPHAKILTSQSSGSARKLLKHDDTLLGSMGLLSGGLVVTTLLQKEHEDWKCALRHQNRRDDEDTWGGFFRDSWENLTRSVKRELEDDNTKALAAIIAANTAVFGLWRFSMGRPLLERLMWKHFACSYNAVAHGGRVHTLLTSAFSHMTFLHFGINMFMLWEFGRQILAPSPNSRNSWYNSALSNSRIVDMFRSATTSNHPRLLELDKFMALYFGSALASSALSIGVSKLRGTAGGTFFIALISASLVFLIVVGDCM